MKKGISIRVEIPYLPNDNTEPRQNENMIYYLTDNNGCYIRKDPASGKYVQIRSADQATTWDDEDKAKNILRNCLNKKMQQEYKVVKVCHPVSDGEDNTATIQAIHVDFEDETIREYEALLRQVSSLLHRLPDIKEHLRQDMKQIEKQKLDARHYIEFGTFNAAQGYKAMKTYQEILRKRRKIKNELQIVEMIQECGVAPDIFTELLKKIDSVMHQSYNPREMPELFADFHMAAKGGVGGT